MNRLITFSLGNEEFAISLLQVREVVALSEITPVPQTPPYFLGVMNLRGQVLGVLDLRIKLGIKPNSANETVVIICDLPDHCVGVVVDSVNAVLSVKDEQITARPESAASKGESVTGVYQAEKNLVLLLDIAKTLNLAAPPKAA